LQKIAISKFIEIKYDISILLSYIYFNIFQNKNTAYIVMILQIERLGKSNSILIRIRNIRFRNIIEILLIKD